MSLLWCVRRQDESIMRKSDCEEACSEASGKAALEDIVMVAQVRVQAQVYRLWID